MGYVVLARKYRPRDFSQMAGQDHVVQALTHALDQRRLHHAYLFTGTRGIGKTTISRILAKSLNCTGADGAGGVTSKPCGSCPACNDIDADRYVDYIELDAASNRSIDEIRDLIERAAYKPAVGRYKVFMIDEAHQLTKDAFNALLKTLEEPPDYLKFVLATTDPERMLPTVLSRCLQFNLRPMSPEVVQQHLAQVLRTEAIDAEPTALRLLAQAARGSMRDALSLTDQAIAFGGGRLTQASVAQMLGVDQSRAAFDILQALGRSDGAALMRAADSLRLSGASASGALDVMARLLQRAAIEQVLAGQVEPDAPDAAEVKSLASLYGAEQLQLVYSIALHGKAELSLMSDEHAALVMVLLRILSFQDSQTPAGARSVPLRAPAPPSLAVTPRASVSKEPTAPADVARVQHEQVQHATQDLKVLADRWDSVVRPLLKDGRLSGLVKELAWQGALVAVNAGPPQVWTLRIAHESLRGPALRDKLEEALGETLGEPVRIELQAGEPADTPAKREAAERAKRQSLAEATIAQDPFVASVLQQFSTAKVVPGSIRPV